MRNTSIKPLAVLACVLFALASSQGTAAAENSGNTLEDFFTAALDYSPALKIAEENLNIGNARKRAATGQLLPQLRANASVNSNRQDRLGTVRDFDGERYSVQLSQVLFNWQAFASRRRASFVEDQLEAEYYYELASVLTRVAERYFNVLQAQDALISIASELEAVQTQLNQVQSLYDRQLAQITDLRQAQASLASVQAQRLRLEAELAIAQEALRSLTGLQPGALFTLDLTIDIPGADRSIQHWTQLARENNQMIRARESALSAAEQRISESRGAYLPDVSFIAQVQDTNLGFDNIPIDQTETTYVGVNVNIPLYTGGTTRAQVSEARSLRNIAENELLQTELDADERVRSAFLQVQANQTLARANQALLESATLSAQSMQEGFALGVVTTVDVLNAIRDQYQAERDLQQVRYEHVKNLLVLKREAGTLSAEDMLEVGSWLIPPEPEPDP